MPSKIERCAIYIRVSTAEQMMHGKSLEAQKQYLTNYAKEHNMTVAGVYADEGKTARKELTLCLHPNAVKKVKMDGKVIPHEVVRTTNIFLFVYVLIFGLSVLLISSWASGSETCSFFIMDSTQFLRGASM